MLKWIGIVLVAATCLLIGNRRTATLRERVRIWEQSARLATMLDSRIRYTAQPIPPLLKELYRTSDLSALGFLPRLADCPAAELASEWCRCVEGELTALSPPDRQLLAAFGGLLGRTDVCGQTAHCRAYAARFEERRAAAEKEFSEKGKLYPTMGLLGGLGVAVLLI